jgi:hypothetical protein
MGQKLKRIHKIECPILKCGYIRKSDHNEIDLRILERGNYFASTTF